jgi:hypothetical protein
VRSFLTDPMIRYSLACMQADRCTATTLPSPGRSVRHGRSEQPTVFAATALALGATVMLLVTATASSQAPAAGEQARVPTSYANVHETPSSGSSPLVLVPQGTLLPVIGRRGEWVQVRLSPELRETGMVMRWYEGKRELVRRGEVITIGDEDSGWMHDSTVEIVPRG